MECLAIVLDVLRYGFIALHVTVIGIVVLAIPLGLYLMVVELVTRRQKTEWH